jgi:membrane protease subunit HflC
LTAPPSNEPALDGLGIEETPAPPTITLQDGSQLTPTIGTDVPAPVDPITPAAPTETPAAPAAPAEAPAAPAAQ